MPDSISKVQRWLDLIAFLVGHRFPVDVDQVMRRVPAYAARWERGDATERASVRRMFERDKDELRSLGIPLETVEYSVDWGAERVQGYRLAREDFYLPYLKLLAEAEGEAPGEGDPGEEGDQASPKPTSEGARRPTAADPFELTRHEAARALEALDHVLERPAFPLRDDARAARRKLTFDLDPGDLGGAPLLWVDPPGAEALSGALDALTDALLDRRRVRFAYHGIRRDERTEREVEPWGLFYQHAHWYLVGRDRTRDARRTFRVARMEGVEIPGRGRATPDYEIPDDFDLAGLRDRSAWELGDDEPSVARVRFRFPRSLWAERNRMGTLEARERDGAQVRSFRVVQRGPFLRWILGLAGEAEILEPEEMVEGFREMARRTLALYGEGGRPPDADADGRAPDPRKEPDG